MSRDNISAFNRALDAGNRRNVEALLAELDPDVERHSSILVLLGGEATVYRGHEGVRELLRDLYAAFSELEAVYPEVRDLGDRVLASGRLRGRGRASGAEVESPLGYVVDFQDAKAIWVHAFTRRGATVPRRLRSSRPRVTQQSRGARAWFRVA